MTLPATLSISLFWCGQCHSEGLVCCLCGGGTRADRLTQVGDACCHAIQVKEPSIFTFWAKSAVDVDQRIIQLKSSSSTTTAILDTLTAACVQVCYFHLLHGLVVMCRELIVKAAEEGLRLFPTLGAHFSCAHYQSDGVDDVDTIVGLLSDKFGEC